MKRSFIWYAVLCCLVLASCGNKSRQTVVDYTLDTDVADTLLPESDSLLFFEQTSGNDEVLPHSADALFDDFIFEFVRQKKIQLDRVHFPIPMVTHYTDTVWIEREKWHHEYLFLGLDYYTMLFNDVEQTELSKDTELMHVDVERLYLATGQFKRFRFERIDGFWYMTQIDINPLSDYPLYGFLTFYHNFVSDTDFEQQHLATPLHYITTDPDDDFHLIEGILDHSQWPAFKPQLPKNVLTNVRYGQQYDNPNRVVLVKQGISNGMVDMLTFVRGEKGWLLHTYEN